MKTANINISLNFEQILNIISQLPNIEKLKLKQYLSKEISNDVDILKDIEQGMDEVKRHSNNEIELKSIEQVIDEL